MAFTTIGTKVGPHPAPTPPQYEETDEGEIIQQSQTPYKAL